jgi:predicted alpha/beta superfamily hydrolase
MTIIFLHLLGLLTAAGPQTNTATIEFIVTVLPKTETGDKLVIVGNLPEVGQWAGKGAELRRQKDGTYTAKLKLPTGVTLEYKITRSSFETVEKGIAGEELPNRLLKIDRDQTVRITVARWADHGAAQPDRPAGRASTITGTTKLHENFHSKSLGNSRTIIVWLPPDYDKREHNRYPVLYMHDGQNLFNAATSFIGVEWGIDETADRLIKSGRIEPIIVVGIYNTPDRMNEYTTTRDAARNAGGKGDAYSKFVVDEVKPFIDKTYRTEPGREHTAIAGSSLGGLISLHIAATHPDTFSMTGVISPALMWDNEKIIRDLSANPAPLSKLKIWLDMGTKEGRQIELFNKAIDTTRRLENVFKSASLIAGKDYQYLEVKGGEHNETAWAARADKMLEFFFAARSDDSKN